MVLMSSRLLSSEFRRSFKVPDKLRLQWFPGHMDKGLKQMQQKLRSVDCLVEVHDARVPLSGRHPGFGRLFGSLRPHVLVLNKRDLAEPRREATVRAVLRERGETHVIHTDCRDRQCRGAKRIIPLAVDLISKSERFHRAEEKQFRIMIIGVPNVGKSSLINLLRNNYLKKSSAAAVGAKAGITRSVTTEIKVCENPEVFVLDTPGVLSPRVTDVEAGMRLALCSCLQDHLVGDELIADYLLYWLNRQGLFSYVSHLGLTEPLDNITQVLATAAAAQGKLRRIRSLDGADRLVPDTQAMAGHFIKAFRTGQLGKIILDSDQLSQEVLGS